MLWVQHMGFTLIKKVRDRFTNAARTAQADKTPFPRTDFAEHLKENYGRKTADAVLDIFGKLGLPPPRGEEEYMKGTEGDLVFLNKYGIVIRIEDKKSTKENWGRRGIKKSPWILQPL